MCCPPNNGDPPVAPVVEPRVWSTATVVTSRLEQTVTHPGLGLPESVSGTSAVPNHGAALVQEPLAGAPLAGVVNAIGVAPFAAQP